MNFRDFFTTNTWWGKFLGAFFGYLIAGPMGSFLGILIGNFFDRGLAIHFSNPHLSYFSEREEVQKIFFESTFLIMGHLAKSDGRVSSQEIHMAELLMNEMRLNKEQKTQAKRLFNEGKASHFKVEPIMAKLKAGCGENQGLLKLFVDIQYRASQVDGLTGNKVKAFDAVLSYLGFAPLHQQHRFFHDFDDLFTSYQKKEERPHSSSSYQRYSKPQPPPNHLALAYSLIEVSPNASQKEVKKAYRRLLSQHHPDKLIAQGLPEEMIRLANDKTHKIRKAYELICESKGWSS